MRIIGIDPGMAIVGYCIMDVEKEGYEDKYNIVNCGSIQTPNTNTESERLVEIHNDLTELIKTYKPAIASVEQLFYFKNAKTVMPVAQARGVIIMTLEQHNIIINEYTPMVIKQTITGYGRADKKEVCQMTKLLVGCETMPKLDDAADAIAIAVCHARQCQCVL